MIIERESLMLKWSIEKNRDKWFPRYIIRVQEAEDEEEEVMETAEKTLQTLKKQLENANLKSMNERIVKIEETINKIAAHLFKEEKKEIEAPPNQEN